MLQVKQHHLINDPKYLLYQRSHQNFDIITPNLGPEFMPQRAYTDYLNFFLAKPEADILSYAYFENSLYEDLLEKNSSYYLFTEEVRLIKQNQENLTRYFQDVHNILEIGPGSNRAIQNKTIPILTNCSLLRRYHAVDRSKQYLTDACNFLQYKFPALNISSTEANLLQPIPIQLSQNLKGKKAIIFLGGTIGNFTKEQQQHTIGQFIALTNPDDLIIITFDTNLNEESLLKTYSNKYTNNFVMGALKYFAKINPPFEKYLNSFDVHCEWNKQSNILEIGFTAKIDVSFKFGCNNIDIMKGQNLKGIKSHKFTQQNISSLFDKDFFSPVTVLENSSSVKVFIYKRR